MVVGRSLDLFYSNNPIYVCRSEVPGFYKTLGLAYNTFDRKNFNTIKENEITNNEKTMQELMKEVRYAQILRPYEFKFNCVSELCGEGEVFKDIRGELTLEMCRSHKYDDLILKLVETVNSKEREKSLKELKDEATQRLSV